MKVTPLLDEELGLQMAADVRKQAVERADGGDIAGASQLIRETVAKLASRPSGGHSRCSAGLI